MKPANYKPPILRGRAAYLAPRKKYTPRLVARAEQLKLGPVLTLKSMGLLAVEFNLPLKSVIEWLELAEVLPTGTWGKLQDRKIVVADVIAAARGKCSGLSGQR